METEYKLQVHSTWGVCLDLVFCVRKRKYFKNFNIILYFEIENSNLKSLKIFGYLFYSFDALI